MMYAEQIPPMLARIAEIRREVDDWEAAVRSLPGGKDTCEVIGKGLIELKWSLEAALEPAGDETESP